MRPVVETVSMPIAPVPFLDGLQLLQLFGSQFGSDLVMRFIHGLADALPRLLSNRFQFCRCLFKNRLQLRELFGGEVEFVAQMFGHAMSQDIVPMIPVHGAMKMRQQKGAGHGAGHEDKEETGDQFPFQ